MSADNIIHEIRTIGTSVDSKIDVQNAKFDSQFHSQNAKFDSQIESQNAKIESLRWLVGVLIALLTLLAMLGFFAFIGRAEHVSDPCAHAESSQALVQPETPASEPLAPADEPPKAQTDGRPERPAVGREPRRGGGADLQEDTLE